MGGSVASNRARASIARRRGFSLIEALIVLAVAGAALMLIFSVGLRSTEIAFRLGRRALDVADRQLATDALRGIIRGLVINPTGSTPSAPTRGLAGEARGFSGSAVLAAATPCAGSGPLGRVTITLAGDASGDVVTCQADAGRTAMLLDLRPRRARFSYSDDGLRWRDAWRDAWRDDPSPFFKNQPQRERTVYIRLATDDGRIEVIEQATSGRPALQPAPPSDVTPSTRPPQL